MKLDLYTWQTLIERRTTCSEFPCKMKLTIEANKPLAPILGQNRFGYNLETVEHLWHVQLVGWVVGHWEHKRPFGKQHFWKHACFIEIHVCAYLCVLMCMWVYVCVFMCMYLHVCISIILNCIYCIYLYVFVFTCLCVYLNAFMCINLCVIY